MPQMNWEQLLSTHRCYESSRKNINDVRSEFRKDYHRIIGSASFRRLQDKTQVFPLDRGDFVRTRLTHSLEVSSFASSMGDTVFRRLMNEGHPEITDRIHEDCCNILECAGLVHDIGNPPFGHFGEFTIREWFTDNLPSLSYKGKPVCELLTPQMKGDLLHFEGNAQALRVLSKLHFLIGTNGMNLTYALLNSIIKYPVTSLGIDKHSGNIKDKKMGYFAAEQELYQKIVSSTGAAESRYPLTFLLEAADDIAYKTADTEDMIRKGMIDYNHLHAELTSDHFLSLCRTDEERTIMSAEAARLEHYLTYAIENDMPTPEENAIQNWLVRMQSKMISAACDSFIDNYDLIMRGEFKTELLSCSPMRVFADALSDIAYRYAFQSKEILKIELSANTMLSFLLDRLTSAALRFDTPQQRITDTKLISVISTNYLRICEMASEGTDDSVQAYSRLLLVTDYICGMTDGFARGLYREISGIA